MVRCKESPRLLAFGRPGVVGATRTYVGKDSPRIGPMAIAATAREMFGSNRSHGLPVEHRCEASVLLGIPSQSARHEQTRGREVFYWSAVLKVPGPPRWV